MKKKTSTKQAKKEKSKAKDEEQQKIAQLAQQELVVVQQILKIDGAVSGIDDVIQDLASNMPRLLKDKVVNASLKKIFSAKNAVAGEEEALRAVGSWFVQKIILTLSDRSGDLGKQSKTLNGSLTLIKLAKNSLGGQNGSDSGERKS